MSHPYFLESFFHEKEGTVYLLSEPTVRLRDSWALVNLVRYFSVHGIKLNIKVVLANCTLISDYYELKDLQKEKEAADGKADLPDLFERLNEIRRDRIAKSPDHLPPLYPSGPILVLGRPSFYPRKFLDEIDKEFEFIRTIQPRFDMMSDDPLDDFTKFRTIRDWYTGIKYRPQPFTRGPSPDPRSSTRIDWGIIRIVKSRFFKHREILYAFGTGSIGTLGTVSCLIDPSWSEYLKEQGNLQSVLETSGYGEVLLKIYKDFHFDLPWAGEFRPKDIILEAAAVPPVSKERAELIDLFLKEPLDADEFTHKKLPYVLADPAHAEDSRSRTFQVTGLHPDDTMSDLSVLQMAGGERIRDFVEELIRMVNHEPKAIFLVGENGVGKEVAARIIYQQRTRNLLEKLAEGAYDNKSIVIGSHFVALNLAAMPESLIERELFGIGEKMANDISGNRGALLNAGEGVALLDEIASMPMALQPKLLRALEFPYEVSPIGFPQRRLHTSAMYVISCNEEPEQLVSAGRLRADLYGRLRQYTIRMPRLNERIADIPALLTYLAEKPVQMDSNTLKALLMRDYPHNVRDLYRFVRSSHRKKGAPADVMKIDLDDIIENRYIHQSADSSASELYDAEPSLDLEFKPLTWLYGPKLFNVIEEAAIILSSLEVVGKEALNTRKCSQSCSDIWPTFEKGTPKPSELIHRWVTIVSEISRARKNKKEREDIITIALQTLGKMFQLRFKGDPHRMYTKVRKEFRKQFDTDKSIRAHDAATSLNISDEGYSNLRIKH